MTVHAIAHRPEQGLLASINTYPSLSTRYDPDRRILCYGLRPDPRPCFTRRTLEDIRALQQDIRNLSDEARARNLPKPVEFLVAHSEAAGGSWLGGDLSMFVDCVRSGDRARLTTYANLAIEVLYANYRQLDRGVCTAALLRGDSLGAGFESALSCDMVIAEEGAQVGFPEVLFNMFPGMGAYSFLSRRASPALVERMISGGKLYGCEEMAEYGGVDHLIPAGSGLEGVFDVIKRQSRRMGTLGGLHAMRRMVNPVTLEELSGITRHWVDTAMNLGAAEIQRMDQLRRAQDRRFGVVTATLEAVSV